MIDITVDVTAAGAVVEIEGRPYAAMTSWDLVRLLGVVIDKTKYSGESMTISVAEGDKKRFVREWRDR